jgi:hypothetical protein
MTCCMPFSLHESGGSSRGRVHVSQEVDFEPQPNLAREQLLAIPLGAFEGIWPSLIVPAAALIAFSFVTANFHALVDSLFALIIPMATVTPSVARPPGRPLGRVGGFPGGFRGLAGVTPLRANARQALVTAAHNRHMIEMVYDGYTRLVEPYKLEYYVRKSDGHGSEYFWDTSGGKSAKIGIKQFFCHKIASAAEIREPMYRNLPWSYECARY